MSLKKRFLRSLAPQFGDPHGLGGRVAGWIMARRPSNIQRSLWAVDLLDIKPTDRVIEIGCGPGVAVAAAASKAALVVGVDPARVVIAQARRRNRRSVRAGRVELFTARAEALPTFDAAFDKALAVNTVGHWDDPVAGLACLDQAMRPGATIAVVSQPRHAGATALDSRAAAAELTRLLEATGHDTVRVEMLDLEPPAVCVLARRP